MFSQLQHRYLDQKLDVIQGKQLNSSNVYAFHVCVLRMVSLWKDRLFAISMWSGANESIPYHLNWK